MRRSGFRGILGETFTSSYPRLFREPSSAPLKSQRMMKQLQERASNQHCIFKIVTTVLVMDRKVAPEEGSADVNADVNSHQERTTSLRPSILVSRPTVAFEASQLEITPIEFLRAVLVLSIPPPVVWGFGMCSIPLFPGFTGLSWQNLPAIFLFSFTGFPTSLMIKTVFQLYYFGMTYKDSFLASSMFGCYIVLLSLVIMLLGVLPLPVHVLWTSLGWFPIHMLVIYLRLKRKGAFSGSSRASRSFFRFSLIHLPIFLYFPVCAFFLLGMASSNGEPLIQASVSVVFSLMSRFMKKKTIDTLPTLLPPHSTSSGQTEDRRNKSGKFSRRNYENIPGDKDITEEDPRESAVRLGLYFAFVFCNELFVMISFSSVTDYTSALFMIFLEVAPFMAFPLRMTSRFYEKFKAKRIRQGLLSSLEDYRRLLLVEEFTLQLLADICATFGFLILTPIWKYGWNSEYFPLRQSCDIEYLTSVGFVIFSGTLVVLAGIMNSVWIWYMYGIHAGRIMATHLSMNGELLFSYAMCVFVFPCGLLLRQANIMYMAVPAAYGERPPGECA